MELKPLKKIIVDDYDLNKIQGYTRDFADQFSDNPFINGRSIDATIGTSATVINHGLQQTPLGWIILDRTNNSNVWRVSWDSKSITLQASVSTTIKLWVF